MSEYQNRRSPDRSHKDPNSPPWCGPYAQPKWCPRRKHWLRVLNEKGQRVVSEHILKYRTYRWGCGQIIAAKYPRIARAINARISNGQLALEDVVAAAESGVMIAALRYDPDRGSFVATSIWAIYQHILSLLDEHSTSLSYLQEASSNDKETEPLTRAHQFTAAPDLAPPELLMESERSSLLHQSIAAANLTPDEANTVQSVVFDGASLAKAAEVHRTSKKVQQDRLQDAMEKISWSAYGIIDHT